MKITMNGIEYEIRWNDDDICLDYPDGILVLENARQWISREAEDDFRDNYSHVKFKTEEQKNDVIDSHIEAYINDDLVMIGYVINNFKQCKQVQP